MGLVMVNAMDKIVLVLVVTAVATQALQIAGIVDTPITAVDVKLNEPVSGNQIIQQNINDLNKEMEATTERSQIIDALFNIPIKTLTVVNNLVQRSRPIFQRLGSYALRTFQSSISGQAPDYTASTI